MKIKDYFDEIKFYFDRIEATHFVLNVVVNFDIRPAEQGYLSGSIHFLDGSVLFFKEFLDLADEHIDKLMYSYHYQGPNNQLIFRYDNSSHKPPLSQKEHKHLPEGVVKIPAPTLKDVLEEILICYTGD